MLLDFLDDAQLDWAGFFPFSAEAGTPAATLDGRVAGRPRRGVAAGVRRAADADHRRPRATTLVRAGAELEVVVEGVDEDTGDAVGRTHREAPEIDGVVRLEGASAREGSVVRGKATAAVGPDLVATPIELLA